MIKPKLLYASPFWPMKSGISEYSENIIDGLGNFFNVSLIIDDYTIENKKINQSYNIIKYKKGIELVDYDYIIYNVGNNPEYHSYMYEMMRDYPGYIILHEYILYYLTVGYYTEKDQIFQKVYELEGVNGIQLIKDSLKTIASRNLLHHKQLANKLPLNEEIINIAKGIFVHSEYTKNLIDKKYSNKDVFVIPFLMPSFNRGNKTFQTDYIKKLYKIDQGAYIIGSVGYIGPSKQNEIVCKAVQEYNKIHKDKIYYIMIGDGDYVDGYLDDYIIKTGFLDNEMFFSAIDACDLIMNLRYPYNGEASGTLVQCMYIGKPCVVTDIGWFSELPDNIVIKVPVRISMNEINELIEKIKLNDMNNLIRSAKNYAGSYCDSKAISKIIYNKLMSKCGKI